MRHAIVFLINSIFIPVYMHFQEFISKLKQQLTQPLPGEEAQYRMASANRKMHLKELLANAKNPKVSAVLVLLYPSGENINILLMQRTTDQGVHSGQVSFPGGKYEIQDGTFENTALREAGEELSILKDRVNIIGGLSPLYIPPSNFLVHPFIGYTVEKPAIVPSKNEVYEVIEADIELLLDDKLKERKVIDVRGYSIDTPYYNIYGHVVWGATAMILSEFEEVLRRIQLS